LERAMGFEPTTASLEGWNSTTELRPPIVECRVQHLYSHSPNAHDLSLACVISWWAGKDSNLGSRWQQIYSLPPLATWVPARNILIHTTKNPNIQRSPSSSSQMMKKEKHTSPRTAPPSLMNKDEGDEAVDTALFRKRWILLMKSGDVKTQNQNYLVFLSDTPIRRNFPDAILLSFLFHTHFIIHFSPYHVIVRTAFTFPSTS
jgi:hypothetical protein